MKPRQIRSILLGPLVGKGDSRWPWDPGGPVDSGYPESASESVKTCQEQIGARAVDDVAERQEEEVTAW